MNPLNSKTILKVVLTANAFHEKLNRFLKDYDLTAQQYNILRILRGQKGNPINLHRLQEHMIHKMSNTTRLIDKLLIKNLVERAICESNRRKVEIVITKKGMALLTDIDPLFDVFEASQVKELTDTDKELLITLLNKIN